MGWVTLCKTVFAQVQYREPKTGQQKFQFYCEDDLLFLSSYYLSMGTGQQQASFNKARIIGNLAGIIGKIATDRLVYEDVRGLSATETCPGIQIQSRTKPKDAGPL